MTDPAVVVLSKFPVAIEEMVRLVVDARAAVRLVVEAKVVKRLVDEAMTAKSVPVVVALPLMVEEAAVERKPERKLAPDTVSAVVEAKLEDAVPEKVALPKVAPAMALRIPATVEEPLLCTLPK